MKQTVPTAPTKYATQYKTLLGVDYQKDLTDVAANRSPKMINMISDVGGNPIKRDGYRNVGEIYAILLTANSIMYGIKEIGDGGNIVISKLSITDYFLTEDETTRIYKNCGNVNTAFSYQYYIYILCDNAIIKFNTEDNTYDLVGTKDNMMSTGTVGESAPVDDDNIPTTVISLKPNGTGGAVLDDKNIMSIYQICTYVSDGSTTQYVIPNYSFIGNWVKVEVENDNGDWNEVAFTLGTSTSKSGKSLDGESTITSNVVSNKVTLTTAPTVPTVAGQDNVRITFAPYSTEQVDSVNRGFYNKTFLALLMSRIAIYYSNRLFLADENRTYYSDVNNPFIVSDLSWFDVDNIIMGYTRSSAYLAIITKDNGRNTIFLASQIDLNDDSSAYEVKASNAGVGAISSKCLGMLNDEPMFLSSTGLFSIETNWLSEKYAINRSARINRQLCKEANLENAVGTSWNGYFFIAINGHMYALDSRHLQKDSAGNKSYEAYYFDNIPIIDNISVVNNRMYFSNEEGTYTWNTDLPETVRYYDKAVYDETTKTWSGDIVCATWSSTFDDDGAPQKLKTLQKKGSMITLVPHYKSGCEITLIKDGDVFERLGSFDTDIFSFESIDFSRFTFSSNSVTSDIFSNKKIKKYKRLQIVLENKKAEPFGITNVIKTYTVGNYAKG